MTLEEAIRSYTDKFDEGPPIYGMEPEDAIAAIEEALERGEPMDRGAEDDIPEDAYL